jgi:hypothetical protein
MSTVLEQLAAREKNDEVAARVAYLQLVKQLAEGVDDPTLEDVERILDVADKSTAELREDVRKRQSRDQLRQQVAAGEAARERRLEIEAALAEATAAFLQAQQAYNAKLASFHWERIDVGRFEQLGNEAARQLRQQCTDPMIQGKVAANQRKLNQLDAAIEAARDRVSEIQAMIHGEQARGERLRDGGGGDGADPDHLARYRSRLDGAQRQLDAFEAKIPPLLAEQKTLLAAAEQV